MQSAGRAVSVPDGAKRKPFRNDGFGLFCHAEQLVRRDAELGVKGEDIVVRGLLFAAQPLADRGLIDMENAGQLFLANPFSIISCLITSLYGIIAHCSPFGLQFFFGNALRFCIIPSYFTRFWKIWLDIGRKT